ncbi:hypothetical protein GF391_03745 [Candidatus Uhrbacteria bacterium]|nr:hypothetical protein [Candidatus Uhrbacteria bacterium]
MNRSTQFFVSCIFVIFGSFLFGCASQIRRQADALTITVPAVMTADEGIREATPKPTPLPNWLDTCLEKGYEANTRLTFEQSPILDFETLKFVSYDLKFGIRGNEWLPLEDGSTIQLRYQRLGRITGRIEIENPNLPVLETMHDFSDSLNNVAKELGLDGKYEEISWSRPANSKKWQSSKVTVIVRMLPPHKLSWFILGQVPAHEAQMTKKIFEGFKRLPSLNSISIDYNMSALEQFGLDVLSPKYRGRLSFRPEYVELLYEYETEADSYGHVCFPVE